MARQLNPDQATNLGLFILAAIKILEGATKQSLPPEIQDLILTIAAGTCLWFTGKPSAASRKGLKLLRLNDEPVADIGDRSDSDRPRDYREGGVLNSRIATEPDVRDRGGDRPTSDDIAAQAAADYWSRNGQRLPNVPSPDVPSNLPDWLEFSQSGGDFDDVTQG